MLKTILKKTPLIPKALHFTLGITLAVFIFSACSKAEKGQEPGGPARVSISVGITPEDNPSKPGLKMMSTGLPSNAKETLLKKETFKGKGIEIDITTAEGYDYSFNEEPKAHKPLNRVQKMSANSSVLKNREMNPLAADIPMQNGVKYWIAFFNKSSQQFEHSQQAIAGTPLTLDVVRNQEYDWYAYSYDNDEEITHANPTEAIVRTSTTAPFLYARGTFKATTAGNTPLSIVFEHQLQQLRLAIDTRGIFGDLSTANVHFTNNSRAIPAFFDVRTGDFATFELGEENKELNFYVVEDDSGRQLEARYYTAEFTQNDYHFEVDKLEVTLPNGEVEDLVDLLPDNQLSFNFATAGKGKIQFAKLNLWRTIPTKKILHIEGNPVYSYAASNPAKASGAFLRDSRNFGPTSDYVRIEGFTHDVQSSGADKLRDALADPADYPDIIIAGMFTGFTVADYDALETYIRRGGVVFLMIENTNLGRPENFFKSIFNSQAVTMKLYDISGSIYKLNNVDSDVLGWPFDDTRGKYWGQDGSSTLYIENIPESEKENIIVYTESSVNRNNQQPGSVSMFRHKNFNFFYVGDTGFLSNEKQWGQYTSSTIEPFATDVNNFPVAHTAYGRAAESNSPEAGTPIRGWHVHNAPIFGNIFAHLLAQAHYMPLDRSPF